MSGRVRRHSGDTQEDDGATFRSRMLLRAVSSRRFRSTESIWLASSWTLCRDRGRVYRGTAETRRGRRAETHLSVPDRNVEDDVLAACCDGGAVHRDAVDPLLVPGDSDGRGLWESEGTKP